MTLTIVFDTDSDCHAIYIEGTLRAEFDEGQFDSKELMDCYEAFAYSRPVKLERIEIMSTALGLHDDVFGGVEWPEQLGELLSENVDDQEKE